MRIPIKEAFEGGQSDPRNQILHTMFAHLGFGERAGTGLVKIKNVWKQKGWEEPEIKEQFNPDRTTLILSMESFEKKKGDVKGDVILNNVEKKIIELIQENKNITQKEIAIQLEKNRNTIYKNIKILKELNVIERIGSDKKGYWIIKYKK